MFNRHRYHSKFKRKVDINLLGLEMKARVELDGYKKLFTLKNLSECKLIFVEYLKQNGDHEPIHGFNEKINKKGNYMLSVFGLGYIPTNQPYAKRIKQIIDEAKENKENLDQARAVFNAVIAIKKIDDEMTENHITTGRVKKGIASLLKKFDLHEDFQQKKLAIEESFKYLEVFGDDEDEDENITDERIISPIFEYESSSFGKQEKKQNKKPKKSM